MASCHAALMRWDEQLHFSIYPAHMKATIHLRNLPLIPQKTVQYSKQPTTHKRTAPKPHRIQQPQGFMQNLVQSYRGHLNTVNNILHALITMQFMEELQDYTGPFPPELKWKQQRHPRQLRSTMLSASSCLYYRGDQLLQESDTKIASSTQISLE